MRPHHSNLTDPGSEQKDALILQLFRTYCSIDGSDKELESQRSKNSRKSSKPPSSDEYAKPKSKNTRNKSDKRSGRQPWHRGHSLEQVDVLDQVIEHTVDQCDMCELDLSSTPVSDVGRRQVFDIPPPPKAQVCKHCAQIKTCPCCDSRNKARFPSQVAQPVRYGNRIQAIATYLIQYQFLPCLYLSQWLSNTSVEEHHEMLNAIISGSLLTLQHINLQGEYNFRQAAANFEPFDMEKIQALRL